MEKRERFSLRKYKIGAVSVLLGAVFLSGGPATVLANENEGNTTDTTNVVDTSDNLSIKEESDVLTEEEHDSSKVVDQSPQPTNLENEKQTKEIKVAEESPQTGNKEVTSLAESVQGDKEPQNIDSNSIINVPTVWETGYKGEGTIVAIIDSGLDVEHDVLKITDVNKAKYKNKEQLEAAKKAANIDYGQWYNDKVIYGYNYVDVNTILKEADKSSHGMHVTSIATGNPSTPSGGELIYGVAPEAQVMFMRVFSDNASTTGPALYVRAIEDAVKLGADSINLSLGGANGSVVNMDATMDAAIATARKAGVSVVIAAGNDGTFGSGHSQPSAENPDYGLVANPSTARDAISVASYNNSSLSSEVVNIIGLESNAELNYGKSSFTLPQNSEKEFEIGKAYEYVFAKLGKTEDFEGLDVTNKLALIKRGEITFSEKIAHAITAGAAGVVIYNNNPGESNLTMSLDETALDIPSIFIPYEFGEALATNQYKIQFNKTIDKQANPAAGLLSDFSSWGLSADGELKPDLAAPGGSIYAAINDNEYASMDGTSMAAPHVAGAAVLVKQYLLKTYPEKSPQEIEALIKHLLMSTAKAHYNTETKAYTSPRQQGAGIIDAAAAISTGVYLTGENGYSSITLGNVGDQIRFEVTLHNITNEDKSFRYVTNLNTDTVEDGHFTLTPHALVEEDGQLVTVKANSTLTVPITLDASSFASDLKELMPKGYYLEGFVRFTDPVDKADVLSIPFVGFRGEFQNLPVVEEPIYNLISDGKGGFYFEPLEDQPHVVDESQHYTGLVTSSSEVIYSTNEQTDPTLKTLGTYKNKDGHFVLELDFHGTPYLAISPNGDNNQDSLAFKGVFLRNYTNLIASVYAGDDVERKTPLWTSEPEGGDKNYYSGNPDNPKSTIVFPTEWSGTDQEGNPLEDGHYQYVLTYSPEVPGADVQTMIFEVVVDREAPIITTATYDEESRKFNPRDAIETGLSGLFREQVFYLATNDSGTTTNIATDESGKLIVTDNKVFVAKNEDGSFTLPLELADIDKFYYTVEDYAGNLVSAKVADLISIGNNLGLVTVKLLDQATGNPVSNAFSYSVKDENGKTVTDLPRYVGDKSTLKLPFGTYTLDLFLYDTEWATVAGETTKTVTIDETNSKDEVHFYVTIKNKADLLIDIDKQLPKGVELQLVTEGGHVIHLPNARYSQTDYGKFVPVGEYKLVANLPQGYEFYEELQVTVVDGIRNKKNLTLIDKTALINLLNELKGIEDTATYYNAASDNQEAYKQALATANSTAATKQNQAEVDASVQKLRQAKQSLNGLPTDTKALEAELALVESIQAEQLYINADSIKKVTYETLIRSAQVILATDKVTQNEVDTVFSNLATARKALDGKATDFSQLEQVLADAIKLKNADVRYLNSSEAAKTGFDQVISEAQALLTDKSVSQLQVNDIVERVKQRQALLDGVAKPNKPKPIVIQPHPKDPTGSTTDDETTKLQNLTNRKGEGKDSSQTVSSQASQQKSSIQKQEIGVSKQTSQASLPQTGQTTTGLTVLGLLLASSATYAFKKKKEQE